MAEIPIFKYPLEIESKTHLDISAWEYSLPNLAERNQVGLSSVTGAGEVINIAQSNENYIDLFYDIEDQLEEIKGKFQKLDIEFENSNINITIEDTTLTDLGKAEGFHWNE